MATMQKYSVAVAFLMLQFFEYFGVHEKAGQFNHGSPKYSNK
jgi:hypothetical protein